MSSPNTKFFARRITFLNRRRSIGHAKVGANQSFLPNATFVKRSTVKTSNVDMSTISPRAPQTITQRRAELASFSSVGILYTSRYKV